ncbi:MAG: indole-3-glycerol-phosphate synthase [Brevinematales bacterium]|nr:indole-3-glycerol-phosphate synthase [Brevinematales bacterium]
MNKLAEILQYKEKEILVLRQKSIVPKPKPVKERYLFQKKLTTSSKPFIIAEVKRKSPSQGDMAMDMDPVALALEYREAGVDAISVLTDEHFFGGSFEFLCEIKKATGLPVLCKDFILDEVQVNMASACGADMVLLIAEAFAERERMRELYEYASSLGMDVLVEVHERDNIRAIQEMDFPIVGVNNRDLKTLTEDYHHSLEVVHLLPQTAWKFSLSALSTTQAVREIMAAGYDGILVGTSLVKNPHRKDQIGEWKRLSQTNTLPA